MSRLAPIPPAALNEAQQAVYEAVTGGKRAAGRQLFRLTHEDGSLTGPFNAALYAPGLGAALLRVGEEIRFGSTLPARARELAILLVARRWGTSYEWYAHVPIGRDVGLSDDVIDAIHNGDAPPLDDPVDVATYRLGEAILHQRPVLDDLYAEGAQALGERGIVELTTLIGYYTTLAMLLEVFAVGVPEGSSPEASS